MGLMKDGLPSDRPPDTEVVFIGFAYADIPFSKQFDVVFPKDKPCDGVRCRCRIIAATQELGKPFPEAPHGWKTICAVHFPEGVPALVRQLPVVGSWYENREWVCICDEETWEHLTLQAKLAISVQNCGQHMNRQGLADDPALKC